MMLHRATLAYGLLLLAFLSAVTSQRLALKGLNPGLLKQEPDYRFTVLVQDSAAPISTRSQLWAYPNTTSLATLSPVVVYLPPGSWNYAAAADRGMNGFIVASSTQVAAASQYQHTFKVTLDVTVSARILAVTAVPSDGNSTSATFCLVAAYRVGTNYMVNFYLSKDAGSTWTKQNSTAETETEPKMGHMSFYDSTRGIAVVGGLTFSTTDGGASWRYHVDLSEVMDVAAAASTTGANGTFTIVVGVLRWTGQSFAMYSSDQGWNWAGIFLPQRTTNVVAVSPSQWIIGVYQLYITTDGGNSWKTYYDASLINLQAMALSRHDNGAGVLMGVGSGWDGQSLVLEHLFDWVSSLSRWTLSLTNVCSGSPSWLS